MKREKLAKENERVAEGRMEAAELQLEHVRDALRLLGVLCCAVLGQVVEAAEEGPRERIALRRKFVHMISHCIDASLAGSMAWHMCAYACV